MGGLLNRSSARKDETKTRVKRGKRRRNEQEDTPFEHNGYPMQDGNDIDDSKMDLMKTYELWNNKYEQSPIINISADPPGAPRTYSPNYSITPHDMMIHPWSSTHDMNNYFYPADSLQSVPSYNLPYDPNQHHLQTQVSTTSGNRSPQAINEERVSKKVQFSTSRPRQQGTMLLKPLTSIHSWHELNTATIDVPSSTVTKPVRLSNRSSAPRSTSLARNPIATQAPVQKPVYIGIDHQATVAERNRIIAKQQHRKNGDRNHSDGLNSSTNNSQPRSHPNHQHKHVKSTDSPRSDNSVIPSRSFDVLKPTISSTNRTIQKSMSENKMALNTDRMPFINPEIKAARSRNARRQQPTSNNEIKPMKSRENQRQHHKRPPSGSPLLFQTVSSTPRIEHTNSRSPVARISLSKMNQQQQKPPIILSQATSTTSISRARI